jgi:predicted DNA-binding transcriptional regulator AlpA
MTDDSDRLHGAHMLEHSLKVSGLEAADAYDVGKALNFPKPIAADPHTVWSKREIDQWLARLRQVARPAAL